MNQDVTLLGSFGFRTALGWHCRRSDIGVGWISLGQPWPQNFPKIDQKTNNANKKCTRTCKKDLGPAGPKVDATVTEQNVDATVKKFMIHNQKWKHK